MRKLFLLFTITIITFTVSSQTYRISRDTMLIPSNACCGFFEEPSGIYFYWINPSMITDGIHFYKEAKGEFRPVKNVKFSTEILDAYRNKSLSFSSLVFISSDTVLSITDKEIVLLDLKRGKILKQTTYNNDSNYRLILPTNRQNLWNAQHRSLAFRLYYIGDYVEDSQKNNTNHFINNRKQYYTGQLVAEVFPETGVVNKLPMEYPISPVFRPYSSYDVFKPTICCNNNLYIIGFQVIPFTYLYNVSTGKSDTIQLYEDEYIPFPDFSNIKDTLRDSCNELHSWIFSKARIYHPLIYDSFTHRYYRFFNQHKNDNSKTFIQGLSMFDEQFHVVGKNIFFDTPLSVYYPTSKGIYGCKPDNGFGVVIEKLEINK